MSNEKKDEGLRVMFVPWKIFGGKSGNKKLPTSLQQVRESTRRTPCLPK